MRHQFIRDQLAQHQALFQALLRDVPDELRHWKPAPDKWCLLEIVCHLYDEEREDFRARLRHVLETPDEPLPSIDPVGWVTQRDYLAQDYDQKKEKI